MPPAAARVVPSAEKTTSGRGVMELRAEAHFVLSASTCADSLGPSDFGARRETVWTAFTVSRPRSVERMKEPTRPVLPITAVVVILNRKIEIESFD